jgi:hypothetical protein
MVVQGRGELQPGKPHDGREITFMQQRLKEQDEGRVVRVPPVRVTRYDREGVMGSRPAQSGGEREKRAMMDMRERSCTPVMSG